MRRSWQQQSNNICSPHYRVIVESVMELCSCLKVDHTSIGELQQWMAFASFTSLDIRAALITLPIIRALADQSHHQHSQMYSSLLTCGCGGVCCLYLKEICMSSCAPERAVLHHCDLLHALLIHQLSPGICTAEMQKCCPLWL